MAAWFDFDEWASLYRHDPNAFEARRHMVLALELARASPTGAARAKAALRQLESQIAGCDDAQRIQISMTWLAASIRELGDGLRELGALAAACGRAQGIGNTGAAGGD